MRRAALVLLMALAASSAGAATKLAGGVQDAGGAPATSGARRLNGSVSQLAVGGSTGGGHGLRHGFWSVTPVLVLAADDGPDASAAAPARLEFGAPTPNPARGAVRFALALPAAARVGLGVYDVSGRQVAALEPRDMPAGRWALEWPGRAADGATLGPGVYFARAVVNGRVVATRRVVRVN